MDIRNAEVRVSAAVGGLLLAAALGCGGSKFHQSAPVVTGYTGTSQQVVDGTTFQVAPVGGNVVITGYNFQKMYSVSFGGYPATWFHVDSANQITATVPDNAVSGYITLQNAGGTDLVFNALQPLLILPEITSISPAAPGATAPATLTGYGLYGPASITFTGASAAVTPSYFDPNTLTVAVPAAATAGPVTLTVNGLAAPTWYAAVATDGSGDLVFSNTASN